MGVESIHLSSRSVESVFLYIASVAVFLLALITFFMLYFVIRYRRKRNPEPEDVEGKLWLEILWTVIPTFLVLTMFYYGLKGFQFMKRMPEGAMRVKVTARQWSWQFEYENGLKSPELRIPIGRPIALALTSQDVIHSFYIPAFKVKQDAVPRMVTHLWFKATEAGTYDVLCAEYCGQQHSYMLTKVIALSEEEFRKWYEEGGKEARILPAGIKLFEEKGCKACHSIDGSPLIGPTIKGLYGKTVTVFSGGRERQVVADEAYLKKSLLEPSADIVKGFLPIMPSQKGFLSEEEINELIRYMKELK